MQVREAGTCEVQAAVPDFDPSEVVRVSCSPQQMLMAMRAENFLELRILRFSEIGTLLSPMAQQGGQQGRGTPLAGTLGRITFFPRTLPSLQTNVQSAEKRRRTSLNCGFADYGAARDAACLTDEETETEAEAAAEDVWEAAASRAKLIVQENFVHAVFVKHGWMGGESRPPSFEALRADLGAKAAHMAAAEEVLNDARRRGDRREQQRVLAQIWDDVLDPHVNRHNAERPMRPGHAGQRPQPCGVHGEPPRAGCGSCVRFVEATEARSRALEDVHAVDDSSGEGRRQR